MDEIFRLQDISSLGHYVLDVCEHTVCGCVGS
jgi:hypothetical protein